MITRRGKNPYRDEKEVCVSFEKGTRSKPAKKKKTGWCLNTTKRPDILCLRKGDTAGGENLHAGRSRDLKSGECPKCYYYLQGERLQKKQKNRKGKFPCEKAGLGRGKSTPCSSESKSSLLTGEEKKNLHFNTKKQQNRLMKKGVLSIMKKACQREERK